MSLQLKVIFGALLVVAVFLVTRFGTSLYTAVQNHAATAQISDNNALALLNPDSDHDGLSDQDEIVYGTDPYNPDTDGDGYPDGEEVAMGYDPLNPASNPKQGGHTIGKNTQGNPNLTSKFVNYTVASIINGQGELDPNKITSQQYADIIQNTVQSAMLELTVPPLTDNDIKINTTKDLDTNFRKQYLATVYQVFGNFVINQTQLNNAISRIWAPAAGPQPADLFFQTYMTLRNTEVPASWKDFHKQLTYDFLELAQSFRFITNEGIGNDPLKASTALNQAQNAYIDMINLYSQFGTMAKSLTQS